MDVNKGPTGRIRDLRAVVAGVTREDVVSVLRNFTLAAAEVYGFADSTDFDLVHEGRRFPPKAVFGLAAKRSIGRVLLPEEFSGGSQSPCFHVLQGLGFVIEPKAPPGALAAAPNHQFVQGSRYQRRDVFKLIGIVDPGGGPMYTGYAAHGEDWFIFCGVNTAGRTGHDYDNRFIGSDLLWRGKTRSSLRQPSIQSLLNPRGSTYIFYRENDRDPVTFAGIGKPKQVRDVVPVEVVWELRPFKSLVSQAEPLPEEIPESITVTEGARKSITVNAYERDRTARHRCIQHWGLACVVCGFDFQRTYGDIGEGFIHVHHLKPLAEIGQEYVLDPVADLRPVCPNCHAMLHRGTAVLEIDDLKLRLRR